MKRSFFKAAFCLTVGGMFSLGMHVATAQTAADAQTAEDLGPPYYDAAVQFWSGQDVVPTFDGWVKNDDGTFTLVFGYFNRNYREELVIPPGPNNHLSAGETDQGQPTLFAPRREKWVFLLKEPSDFGNKQVVWTLHAHGRTETATGWLVPALQITQRLIMSKGNLSPGLDDPNKAPSISIEPAKDASVSHPLNLTALVTDDGLPKPIEMKTALKGAQTNGTIRPVTLTAHWLEYRGPAGVRFDEKEPKEVEDGKVTTAVHFSQPGTYVLIATADDSELTDSKTVTIEVSK